MRAYRAGNGRIINRSGNGRFRRTTLQDFGIAKSEIATEPKTCAHCGFVWQPILKCGYCPKCDKQ